MYQIQNITSDPLQSRSLVLQDGSVVRIQIYYRPSQNGWFFNYISWNSFLVRGIRITNLPDILYPFKNQIDFGIACFSAGNREPYLVTDFQLGNSKLYLLTSDEVTEYEDYLQDG